MTEADPESKGTPPPKKANVTGGGRLSVTVRLDASSPAGELEARVGTVDNEKKGTKDEYRIDLKEAERVSRRRRQAEESDREGIG
jgi:hypothetical protein